MKRADILEAALELFEERGYAATPVPAIAERAGVAVGSIYRVFPSKEALVNELYREGKARMAAHLPTAADLTGLSVRDGVGQWWSGLYEYLAADGPWLRFCETHHHAAYLDDASRATAATLDDAAEAFVARGQGAGELRQGPPAELVAMVLGAFLGLVRTGQADPARAADTGAAVWAMIATERTVRTSS